MRNGTEKIETDDLCSYGCGEIAKYKNKSHKLMCCSSSNSCPENKKKNSLSLKQNYKEGNRISASEVYSQLSQEKKDNINWRKGKRFADFSYGGTGNHKSALIQERGYKCECCQLSEWMGKEIPLELDHIDGDRKNNTKENLKLLCLNCHGQTPTWRRSKNPHKKNTKKHTDEEIINAIINSKSLNQTLEKLDLRYGAVSSIVSTMVKYRISFKED